MVGRVTIHSCNSPLAPERRHMAWRTRACTAVARVPLFTALSPSHVSQLDFTGECVGSSCENILSGYIF